jgi:hypothetical protein
MLDALSIVLRIIGGCAGILLIYASFSYEREDGRIQSLLEEWWIRIDDFRHQAISFHVAFMKVIAAVLTSFLDRLFGTRLVSFRSFGVSICYSLVCVGTTVIILSRLYATPDANPDAVSSMIWLIAFGIGYGSIPALIPKDAWQLRWLPWIQVWFWVLVFQGVQSFFTPVSALVVYGLANSQLDPELRVGALFGLSFILSIVLSISLAMVLFAGFVGIMRVTLRTISHSQSPIKITGLTLLNAAPIVMFYGLIKLIELSARYEGSSARLLLLFVFLVVGCVLLFNLAFALAGVLFVCLASLMLLHRLFYPFIQRPLYFLQRLGVAKRPRVFAVIGAVLLGVAFGKLEWLKAILDKLH